MSISISEAANLMNSGNQNHVLINTITWPDGEKYQMRFKSERLRFSVLTAAAKYEMDSGRSITSEEQWNLGAGVFVRTSLCEKQAYSCGRASFSL